MPILSHLAIIMDGNGRWAQARGLARSAGHRAGTLAAREIVREARRLEIPNLTLYTFSRENWRRPPQEIAFLFELLREFLSQELPELERTGIRLRVLGELDDIPTPTRQVLQHALRRTAHGSAMTLALALNYSGRLEIVRACQKLAQQKEVITEASLAAHLFTADMPDPDLIIRTGGELRLSNFLLFQSAYSELYFTDTPWPEFSPEHLHRALEDFRRRQRRFGAAPEEA
ncbi:MAG: di-trans,poly-cis-decaprenylcistransferase [Desulfomicrobiaceae bacterium]|nr:di-trans,poly-cis-decaprenylcistransferase [Desulfomicrobiaceae bacterium]